jgi:hypothetical protein
MIIGIVRNVPFVLRFLVLTSKKVYVKRASFLGAVLPKPKKVKNNTNITNNIDFKGLFSEQYKEQLEQYKGLPYAFRFPKSLVSWL